MALDGICIAALTYELNERLAGGRISKIVQPERDALLQCLRGVDDRGYSVLCCDWRNRRGDPPIAVFVWRDT